MHITVTRFPYESALGGEEYHTLELMAYMQQKGASVRFVGSCPTMLAESAKRGFAATAMPGIKMPVTPMALLFFLVAWPWQLWQFFKYSAVLFPEKNTTVYCLSLTEKFLLTPIAHFKGTKVVWVEHQKIGNWLLKSPLRLLYKWFSAYATIVPISPYNNTILRTVVGVSTDSLAVIVHGIDVPTFYCKRNMSTTSLIGYTGRLERCKGLHTLVEAVAALAPTKPGLTCVIVGTGEQQPELEMLIKQHSLEGVIRIIPPLSRAEYIHFLQSLDVFVLPSLDESETFGLSAAEAAVAGAQLVATSVTGIAQLLPNSILQSVTPNDPLVLSQAIASNLQLAKAGNDSLQQMAIELFNKDRMLAQYESLLLTT